MRTVLLISVVFSFCTSAFAQTEIIALPFQNRWQINDSGNDLTLRYNLPFFEDTPFYNDDDWRTAKAPFGFGYSINTEIVRNTDSTETPLTTYFLAEDPRFLHFADQIDELFVTVRYDDSFVLYINGVEVARRNLFPISFSGTAATRNQGMVEERINITPFKLLLSPINYLDNFISAELHLNSTNADSAFFDAQISYTVGSRLPSQINHLTAGPYLSPSTQNQATISYYSAAPAPTIIRYGLEATNLNQTFRDDSLKNHHEAVLNRLQPGQTYFYEIDGITAYANIPGQKFVKTAPPIGKDTVTNIWVTGDFGVGLPTQHLVYADYLLKKGQTETDLWMWLGDNAYDVGSFGEYQRNVFDIYSLILPNHVILPSLGNHDVKSCITLQDQGPYFEMFNLPKNGETNTVPSGTEAYYSYNYANIHFICLESTDNNRMRDGKMMQWLEEDLKHNRAKWTIAFWHHPPYSKSSHDSDTDGRMTEIRENANPLLEKYGVDLVLCGHSHGYERSFLLDGHYGKSETFNANQHTPFTTGDGGDEPYEKTITKVGHKGTVYAVVGSSGSPYTEGSLDHAAMVANAQNIGSMLLQINGDELHAEFISPISLPGFTDKFNIVKTNEAVPCTSELNLEDKLMVCGDAVELKAGPQFWDYLWSTGSRDSNITVSESGWYTLEVQQFQDCFDRDSVFVEFIEADIERSVAQPCFGETVTLTVLNADELLWNDSLSAKSFDVKSSQNVKFSGIIDGCEIKDEIAVDFIDFPLALTTFTNLDATLAESFEYRLNNPSDYESILWDLGDGTTDTAAFGQHFYSNPGQYAGNLKLTNGNCSINRGFSVNRTVTSIASLEKPLVYVKSIQKQLEINGLQTGTLVAVKDVSGKELWRGPVDDTRIDLSHLSTGRYFLQYTNQQKNESVGFMLQ